MQLCSDKKLSVTMHSHDENSTNFFCYTLELIHLDPQINCILSVKISLITKFNCAIFC